MPVYFPPSLNFTPTRLVFSTWMDHLPFGYDIVVAQEPKILVELGSYRGFSFFAFCQVLVEHDLECLCYAVDCWSGDMDTGEYDESIFLSVQQYCREHYRGFAYLLKMFFDRALGQFEDERPRYLFEAPVQRRAGQPGALPEVVLLRRRLQHAGRLCADPRALGAAA